MVKIPSIPPQYLKPLHINNLTGRVLALPASNPAQKLPIVFVYGHHSSLERMFSTAQAFNKYGPVVIPDLPGFGGMPSLTTVGKKPSIDNLADYMAAFIRQQYPQGEKFILGGLSLGFVIAARMLQRHPDLTAQVAHLISIVGFAHYDDFLTSPTRRRWLARTARLMAKRASAATFSGVVLRKPIIAATYHLRARNHPKMKGYTWQERQDLIDFETVLWRTNEARTYFTTGAEMLTLDLTRHKIPLAVEHVGSDDDQYLSNERVLAHFGQIFTKVHAHKAHLPNHAPTVLEDAEDAAALLPASLVHIFGSKA